MNISEINKEVITMTREDLNKMLDEFNYNMEKIKIHHYIDPKDKNDAFNEEYDKFYEMIKAMCMYRVITSREFVYIDEQAEEILGIYTME
jgi:hypothetical protein